MGVVIVPADQAPGWQGESPAAQRVANRPIVCHVLDALLAAGAQRLAVVAALADLPEIREIVATQGGPALDVTFLAADPRRELLGALEAAAPFVGGDPAIAHLASGLVGQPLNPIAERLLAEAPDLLMLLHRGTGATHELLGSATESLLGVAELDGSRSRLSLAGVCAFGPGALARVARSSPRHGAPVQLVEVAEALVADGLVVEAGHVRAWRRYAGDPRDLLELNHSVLDRQTSDCGHIADSDSRVEGRVVIDATAHVTSSVILGPSIIGPGASVADSYIGPYTSIGPGALIEGSEVVRSIVAEGARIMHIERIEGSLIGRRASIVRDFSLPRAIRLHVGEDVEVTLD